MAREAMPEQATFRQKGRDTTVTFSNPVDIQSMRNDSNWVEVMEDGKELDRHTGERAEWDFPAEYVAPQQARVRRGRK